MNEEELRRWVTARFPVTDIPDFQTVLNRSPARRRLRMSAATAAVLLVFAMAGLALPGRHPAAVARIPPSPSTDWLLNIDTSTALAADKRNEG